MKKTGSFVFQLKPGTGTGTNEQPASTSVQKSGASVSRYTPMKVTVTSVDANDNDVTTTHSNGDVLQANGTVIGDNNETYSVRNTTVINTRILRDGRGEGGSNNSDGSLITHTVGDDGDDNRTIDKKHVVTYRPPVDNDISAQKQMLVASIGSIGQELRIKRRSYFNDVANTDADIAAQRGGESITLSKSFKVLLTGGQKQLQENLLNFHRLVSRRWEIAPGSVSPTLTTQSRKAIPEAPKEKDLFEYVRNNIIGDDLVFEGAFGFRKIVYCDNTASGRSLAFIEDYIKENVLPSYGNTHTTTSETAIQTSQFRNDARAIIHKSVNGGPEDEVIFAGSGCTGAIQKLLHVLNFETPPIIFLSRYEHHSNLLPWKEIGAEIRWAYQDENGDIDLDQLSKELQQVSNVGRDVIGTFSAGSNITGILANTDAIAACLHRHGAIAFFDYASAGPYVRIDMNPAEDSPYGTLAYKDAIFCSPHKFIGGPGTTGILVAKRNMFRNTVPSAPGGGTVLYVTETSHRYISEIREKEEGGTPAIVESIRTGLVFQLKDALTPERILERDDELVRKAHKRWKTCPNLIVLAGTTNTNKLPVFSFLIRHAESGRLLHHNFISRLLNDLFGIQCRGGCMCAGPYAEQLLGIDEATALQIGELLFADADLEEQNLRKKKAEILKPGFTRLNLSYYMTDDYVNMIVEAVAMISEHGWKFLPQYSFDAGTAGWKHSTFESCEQNMTLANVSYDQGVMQHGWRKDNSHLAPTHVALAENVRRIARYLYETAENADDISISIEPLYSSPEWENLRWFLLPEEATCYIHGKVPDSCVEYEMPFFPGRRANESAKQTNIRRPSVCECKDHRKADGGIGSSACTKTSPGQNRKDQGGSKKQKRRIKTSPLT